MKIVSNKALAVCNHPGGARAILPVIKEFIDKDDSLEFDIFLTINSLNIFKGFKKNIKIFMLTEIFDKSKIVNLTFESYIFALASTSISGNLEKEFIKLLRKRKIPTFSVLDHWCDYKNRFGFDLEAVPDIIFAPDSNAKNSLLNMGINSSRIVISGHPAFDNFPELRNSFSLKDKAKILNTLGLESSNFITFSSEPVTLDHDVEKLGYSEISVLSQLCQTLMAIGSSAPHLVIKPHPRENSIKIRELVKNFNISCTIVEEIDRHKLMLSSKAVFGMDSLFLLESSKLNIPTYSIQIEWDFPSVIDFSNYNVSIIKNEIKMKSAILNPIAVKRYLNTLPKKGAMSIYRYISVSI